ncbi:hypothetical protein BDV26DRAFT_256904 [Aspergillus bertholletiae]|uniref:Uncharacterized protein n=1 Tax=Aspergillus bertholletiae TaxID=1226010 RepID=A0A5N7BG42_9EURO|nr:hypothetical protein BDV26DRAFT_256904 [Aspergillus bertholletiae]
MFGPRLRRRWSRSIEMRLLWMVEICVGLSYWVLVGPYTILFNLYVEYDCGGYNYSTK